MARLAIQSDGFLVEPDKVDIKGHIHVLSSPEPRAPGEVIGW